MHLVLFRSIRSARLAPGLGVEGVKYVNAIRFGGLQRSGSSYCSCTGDQKTLLSSHSLFRNQLKLQLVPSRVGAKNFSSTSDSGSKQSLEGENQLKETIKKAFPNATNIIVEDISGGCGSLYQVYIEAPDFKGLSTVKQHLLVNQALKQEIKNMHGIRITTGIPP